MAKGYTDKGRCDPLPEYGRNEAPDMVISTEDGKVAMWIRASDAPAPESYHWSRPAGRGKRIYYLLLGTLLLLLGLALIIAY